MFCFTILHLAKIAFVGRDPKGTCTLPRSSRFSSAKPWPGAIRCMLQCRMPVSA